MYNSSNSSFDRSEKGVTSWTAMGFSTWCLTALIMFFPFEWEIEFEPRSSDLLLRLFRWSSQGKKRVTQGKESKHSLIPRASRNVSQSSIVVHAKRAASEAAVVSKKLLCSTSKVAWIADTTFLMLAVPFIIEMDRDQQLTEIELQNASLLGTTPTPK